MRHHGLDKLTPFSPNVDTIRILLTWAVGPPEGLEGHSSTTFSAVVQKIEAYTMSSLSLRSVDNIYSYTVVFSKRDIQNLVRY